MLKRFLVFVIIVFSMMGISVTASAYQVSSSTKYVYVDDNGTVTRYTTSADNVERFLRFIDVKIGSKDILEADLKAPIETGMTITVKRGKQVTLVLDGVERRVNTVKQTVGELLEEYKDLLCEEFVAIGISNDAMLTDGMVINLASSEVRTYTKSEKINYQTTYIDDNTMYVGEEVVITPGADGEVQTVYKEIYSKEVLIATEEVSKTVISEPTTAVVKRGTIDSINGMKFKRAAKMLVTGYTPFDEGCTGVTASGKKAGFGIIAADTRVFPFGTKIYVPGYGVGVVEDRGGAIKGNRLDLCYNTVGDALKWGVKNINVYILE